MSVTLEAGAVEDNGVFPKPICLSFSGCGFLGLYHVGVAICINEHRHLLKIEKIGGASAGALTGTHLLCGGEFGEVILELFEVATKARSGWLGPFSPNFNIVEHLRDGLRRFLPADAHKICSGRLFISMTRVSDAVNVVVSHYTSREDLIQALICSSFVPVFSGIVPPLFRGRRYWDGGITDNLPKFDSETVTISPFSGVSSICPEDVPQASFNLNVVNTSFKWSTSNFNRLSRALFPPNPESLRQLVREGYRDALKFVQKITAYIPDEPTPLTEEEQQYFRLKQARQIKRENAVRRSMDKKSIVLENVPAAKLQPQPMGTITDNDSDLAAAAAAARQQRANDNDTESGVASSAEDDVLAAPSSSTEPPSHRSAIHVSNLNDATKILDAATVLAEHGETNVTRLRDAGPYELSVLSRRPSLRSLGVIDNVHAADDDDESHDRYSLRNRKSDEQISAGSRKSSLMRTHSADDLRLLMNSIRRHASNEHTDGDDAESDDDEHGAHRRRPQHRYVSEMPNYLSNALQEACIQDFISGNPYQTNFTILPIPWTLPLELTHSIILSMIEAIPNRSARWWQTASERSYAKRCLLMLRHTLGLIIGQLVRSHDRRASNAVVLDDSPVHEAVEAEIQHRERFLDNVLSHVRHHAPAPVTFVVNKSVGAAHRAVSRSTRMGRKAASYAFGLDRYNTDDDYDYDSDDEFTSCGTDSEAHFTVVSRKRNASAAALNNTTATSMSEDERFARQKTDVDALIKLNENQAVAALLGASEVYTSPTKSSAAANGDRWFDYDAAYDRDYSRPHSSNTAALSSTSLLLPSTTVPTIVEEDEESIAPPYSPRLPRSNSRMSALAGSTPVSPSMQRKHAASKSSPASPRKTSYTDGTLSSSSSSAATAAAAAAQLEAATRNGQQLSSSIHSLNVAGIDDCYGSTSFIRGQPVIAPPANKRPRSSSAAPVEQEPKLHWVVTPGSAVLTSAVVDRNVSKAEQKLVAPSAMDETDFAPLDTLNRTTRRSEARRKAKAENTDIDADDEEDAENVGSSDDRSRSRVANEAMHDVDGDAQNNDRHRASMVSRFNKTFASVVNALYSNTTPNDGSE